MADKFKIGDLVRARGLPSPADMLVGGYVGSSNLIQCIWFSGKKHETARFDEETLILSPSPPIE